MAAADYPLKIEQRAQFLAEIKWTNPDGSPINFNGMTGKMQVRDAPGGNLLADFNTSPNSLTLLTAGTVLAYLDAATTTALNFARAYYDLLILDAGGHPFRILKGPIYLDLGVSQ